MLAVEGRTPRRKVRPHREGEVVNHPDELHDHDRGLSHDLPTLLNRRRALGLLGAAGLALAGCSQTESGPTPADAGTPPPPGSVADQPTMAVGKGQIPEETAGPYPADGSNGVSVLTESGIVRSDITTSFGTASAVATGVPLTIKLKVLDTKGGSNPLHGATVYVWHCDNAGRYSMYSSGVTEENYLRGVQEADRAGEVTFTSIYPAAYSGRWPHIHFEVYPSLVKATTATGRLRTSQLALPEDICRRVYATDGYPGSDSNLDDMSLQTDPVFGDGYSLQLANVDGSVGGGYTATLHVPV